MTPDLPNDQTDINGLETNTRAYHRPLIPLLCAFIAGIIAARMISIPYFLFAAWIFIPICLFLLLRSLVRQQPAKIAPLVLFFLLGWVAISPWLPSAFPPETVLPYLDQKPCKISGIVLEAPVQEGFRTRCVLSRLAVHTGNTPKTPLSLPGRIQLTVYGKAPEILPGDRITMNRPIRSIRNFNNPGGFNYRQYMAYKNIWGTAWDKGDRIIVSPSGTGPTVTSAISTMRMSIDRAIASVSQNDTRAVLSALVIGKKDLITPKLREAFSRAGVSHLLAISGLHVGIVAFVVFFLLTAAMSRNTYLLKRAVVKKCAALLSMVFVIGYGLIAGMSPSTQRAVIMICIFLLAFVFDRQYNPANTLAAAALGILAVSPHSLFNISFQLSFAAVTAILIGLYWIPPPPKTADESLTKGFLRLVTGFAWVSVLAIIGTMPLVAYYFNQVSVLGIAANLLLVPLIGFIVVPVGLTSAFLYIIFKPAALAGFSLADSLLSAALFIVDRISALPFGVFKTVTPSIIELLCIYTILISIPLLWQTVKDRKEKHGKTGPGPDAPAYQRNAGGVPVVRKKTAIAGIVCIAMTVMIVDTAYWIHRRYLHTDMIVTYMDVGQGNAALIEIPGGKTMLIDGGGFSDNARFDVGELIVAPFLWRNKIRRIDTVILSHPHSDHLNGLLYILENFNIGKVISTHYPSDSASYQRFLEIIEKRGIVHSSVSGIQHKKNINRVAVHIIYPPKHEAEGPPQASAPANTNDGSIILKLTFKDTSFLFPGDVESATEAKVVPMAGSSLASTFLLAPHHGSGTSSTPIFLSAVNPETVIISARKDRFGFPAEAVLNRYEQRGYTVYETEQHGAVRVVVNGDGVRVATIMKGEQPVIGENPY